MEAAHRSRPRRRSCASVRAPKSGKATYPARGRHSLQHRWPLALKQPPTRTAARHNFEGMRAASMKPRGRTSSRCKHELGRTAWPLCFALPPSSTPQPPSCLLTGVALMTRYPGRLPVTPSLVLFVRPLYAQQSVYLWWDGAGACHRILVSRATRWLPLFALAQHAGYWQSMQGSETTTSALALLQFPLADPELLCVDFFCGRLFPFSCGPREPGTPPQPKRAAEKGERSVHADAAASRAKAEGWARTGQPKQGHPSFGTAGNSTRCEYAMCAIGILVTIFEGVAPGQAGALTAVPANPSTRLTPGSTR